MFVRRTLLLPLFATLLVLILVASLTPASAIVAAPSTDTPATLAADPLHQIFLPLVQRTFPPTTFPNDAHTLALLPLNGDTQDQSGNNRHATLISGTFVPTALGQGLQITGTSAGGGQGFQWSAYANLLVHPYSVEMIVTPQETSSFRKLFSFADNNDSGWYYHSNGLRAYPNGLLGQGQAQPNVRHYIAFVSKDNENIEIYLQGVSIGTTNSSFTAPPSQAIFFNDDLGTGRGEQLAGVVEEVRISNSSRTAAEIQAIQNTLLP